MLNSHKMTHVFALSVDYPGIVFVRKQVNGRIHGVFGPGHKERSVQKSRPFIGEFHRHRSGLLPALGPSVGGQRPVKNLPSFLELISSNLRLNRIRADIRQGAGKG